MDMGMKKIQVHFLSEKIGEFATNMSVTSDEITFDIAEEYLFKGDTANPGDQFVNIMERVRGIVEGLKDTNIYVNSEKPFRVGKSESSVRNLAESRLDFILHKVQMGITEPSVDLLGKITVEKISSKEGRRDERGYIKFRIRQKDAPKDIKLKVNNNDQYGARDEAENVYDNFVNQLTKKAEGSDKEGSTKKE
jgi:hypothetical protein